MTFSIIWSISKEKEMQLIYKVVSWYCNEKLFATANIICNRWIAGPKKYYNKSEKGITEIHEIL